MKKSILLIALTLILTLSGCAATSDEAPAETADATTIAQTTVPEVTTAAPIATTTTATTTSAEATTTTAATTTAEETTTAPATTAPPQTTAPIATTTAAVTTAKPVQTTAPATTTAAVTTTEEYKGFTEADCLYIISECEKYMEEKGYDYCNLIEGYNSKDPCLSYMIQEVDSPRYGWLFQNSTWGYGDAGNSYSRRDTPEMVIEYLKDEIDAEASMNRGTMIIDYCSNIARAQSKYPIHFLYADSREGLYTFIICVE